MSEPRRLGLLEERRAELETCAYCPKLCRAACPVSDAEANESVTPWGKMSAVYALSRGLAEPSPEYAALSWACSGCFGCRERCDHRNPVRDTLYDARRSELERGLAPPRVAAFARGFSARLSRIEARVDQLRTRHAHSAEAQTALLVGCDYTLHLEAEADAGIAAARALFGPLRLLAGCCGEPLRAAGAQEQALKLKQELLAQARGAKRVIALDAGCAYALRGEALPFARAAADALEARPRSGRAVFAGGRYHDPCLLGRGLGEYAAPRALLRRALGHEPLEFSRRESAGRCSGGGGLLPLTRPETASAIARDRVDEHERLGGGTIVSACAASVRNLRAAGANVVDLLTIVRRLTES